MAVRPHRTISYSKYMRVLGPFFDKARRARVARRCHDSEVSPPCGAQVEREFTSLRNAAYSVLQQETSLSEIVQLVGKDSLSEDQKMLLEVAKIIREDYLQQNAFSEYDFTCPLYKSIGMLRCILAFYNRGMKAITESQVCRLPPAAVRAQHSA